MLGGSFNPVHTGHIRMAIETREQLGLDRVELIPAKQPPHKDGSGILPFDLRMKFVEAAIEDIPGLGANPIESKRSGPSFTCDTLNCFQAEQPKNEVFFIMGAATFLELKQWHRGLDIPDLASLAVVNRWTAADKVADSIAENWPDAKMIEPDQWTFSSGNHLYRLDIPRLDIKGGDVRERWLSGRNISLLVPDAVRRLMDGHGDEVRAVWQGDNG